MAVASSIKSGAVGHPTHTLENEDIKNSWNCNDFFGLRYHFSNVSGNRDSL